jgi:hypothetical protein
MSLREVALNLGVKRKDTCKLFYGQYPYSVTMSIPQQLIDDKKNHMLEYWRNLQRRKADKPTSWTMAMRSISAIRKHFNQRVKAHVADFIAGNRDILKGNYLQTHSPTSFTVYLLDAQTTQALIENNDDVIRYTDPYNDKCAEYLAKGDPKVLVRQNLFEGEHEFRITFKPSEDYASLDARVETLKFFKRSYNYGAKVRALCVSGEDDLFLARLGLEDQIEQITKCVLTTEV